VIQSPDHNRNLEPKQQRQRNQSQFEKQKYSNQDKPRNICKFYEKGYCRDGDACPSLHPNPRTQKLPIPRGQTGQQQQTRSQAQQKQQQQQPRQDRTPNLNKKNRENEDEIAQKLTETQIQLQQLQIQQMQLQLQQQQLKLDGLNKSQQSPQNLSQQKQKTANRK